MSLDGVLWLAVLVLLGVAGRLSIPRPPQLDWERFFKTTLVTLMRGPIEASGGNATEWLSACRARVWFNPGARDLAAKVADPSNYQVPVPALAGERALMEDLVRLADPQARLGRVFWEEPRSDEVLFDDPLLLGEAYATVPVLGPGADWEAVAQWQSTVVEGLRRRLEHTRWLVVGDEALAAALALELGEDRAVALSEQVEEGLEKAASERVPKTSDRLIWVGVGEGAGAVVRALHGSPALRDRTRAVVAVGATLGGEMKAWMSEHFDHAAMDTELSRTTPYFHLAFVVPGVEPLGEEGRPLVDTCWPMLAPPATGRVAIEAVDLGVLPGPLCDLGSGLLGRALLLTVVQRLSLVG